MQAHGSCSVGDAICWVPPWLYMSWKWNSGIGVTVGLNAERLQD